MTGYATIKKIHEFEERAAKLGFEIQQPTEYKYNTTYSATSSFKSVWVDEISSDNVSLTPADDRYPCWRRGASVFHGTIEEAKFFFQGIEFAHTSDAAIGMGAEKKRAQAEARYIERQRRQEEARIKKAEQKRVWDILKYGKVNAKDYDEVPF
jgi:hypothetical protein